MTLLLDEELKNDQPLLAWYKIKLLDPGWAGELTDAEAEYISIELSKNPTLRGTWRRALKDAGYTGRRRKKPSIYVIKLWNDVICGFVTTPTP